MKIVCNREGLLTACQLASVAIPSRDVKPILTNIKAVADEGQCTLMATDLEIGLRLEVRGLEVLEPGEAILPASKLVEILREAGDQNLTLEANPSACTITGPSLEFEMPSEDPAQFPDIQTFQGEKYHQLTAETLREMIRRTAFAAAVATQRYSMTGVLWELEGDMARLVATDGKRLAWSQAIATDHGGHSTKGQSPVVPTKAMGLLERVLNDPEEQVRVTFRPNEVLFKTETATIYSRLVEGRFPDYRQVLPKKHVAQVTLAVGPFYSAVRQAAIMVDEETSKVSFRFENGKLLLKAAGAKTGRSKVELPIEYDAKPIEIYFNPKYLADMLKVLPPESAVELDLISGDSPALFRAGPNYQYLVMPLG